jgi:hypothetical protein
MYLATVDCAISNPSLSSSPRMRGAPKSGFSMLIRRISVRNSVSICGRPPRPNDFQTPITTKAGPMPTHQRFRLDNPQDLQDGGKRSIHHEPGSAGHLAPQNDQLMSERSILSLKPALRLVWRGQHGQNKPDQRDHRANLPDSVTRQIRIRFSVHTGTSLPQQQRLLFFPLQCQPRKISPVMSICPSSHPPSRVTLRTYVSFRYGHKGCSQIMLSG